MKSSIWMVSAAAALAALAIAGEAFGRATANPKLSEDPLLSAVVNGRLSSLQVLDFKARNRLTLQAKEFESFRRNRLSESQRKKWLDSCANSSDRSVFCPELISRSSQETELQGIPTPKGKASRIEIDQAYSALIEGKFGSLKSSSESSIFQALKKVSDLSSLSKISDAVLEQSFCDAMPLSFRLAQKTEEFLPEPVAQTLVTKLYEHAASCKIDSAGTTLAKYRLSLFLISQGEWSKAERWLDQLTQDSKTDYYSRSMYWKARAARARGDQLAFEQTKAKLVREFPIHYHSLLLSGKKAFNSAQNLHLPEPVVKFESPALGSQWNDRIRAIEVLQDRGSLEYTRTFFEALENVMDQAEPEARLYLVVLQVRNGNAIGAFRTLSSLMRTHPAVLSKQTLSLFFPLTKEHRHMLYSVTGGGLDPYLIAALIRQESGFIRTARSPAGALGLMQLMPATAKRLDRVSKRDLLDGRTNVRVGVKFFRQLLNRFSGKVDLALAAYNAGPERVDDWLRRYQVSDPVLFVDLIPFRETREYVSLISRNYYWYLQIYARHIFDERLEAAKKSSKNDPKVSVASAQTSDRSPAGSNFPLEFSLFSAH
ncbi:MAG: lytic transglycosylase domain-containing protein [Bdellovibrionales bacterium]|nr:lytic transglycosylase domain-containing protein [Bdellovibrionales bacterium]